MEKKINSFTQNDYEIVQREVPYEGVFRMSRCHVRFKLFKGGWSNIVIREVMERWPAVAILPYDPVLDKLVLIEQFRIGALANPQSPWLIEIIAGVFNREEEPVAAVMREAQEEAHCEILDIYPICEYFVSPGGSNEYIQLYAGRIDATDVGGIHGLPEENEDIRVLCVDADEACKMLQEGKIKTSPAIVSLLWFQLNREWLKQLWQTK